MEVDNVLISVSVVLMFLKFFSVRYCMMCFCVFSEPLPVPCSFCDRRFRNLAALNGHMRLHGGYVKKVCLNSLAVVQSF